MTCKSVDLHVSGQLLLPKIRYSAKIILGFVPPKSSLISNNKLTKRICSGKVPNM